MPFKETYYIEVFIACLNSIKNVKPDHYPLKNTFTFIQYE
jgi:hypothetical protein